MGLRVLITTFQLYRRSGVALYTRDLALALHSQGHLPVIYTLGKGAVSDELQKTGIRVAGDCKRLDFQPDIIHGNDYLTTMLALRRFPGVPTIFICHGHTRLDETPLHPRIRRYFGVSRICVEHLLQDGVPDDGVGLLLNFVDLKRFLPRPPLPERPRRALVFSNRAHAGTHLPAVTEACRRAGLELDVVGLGVGTAVARPEEILGEYDIVFAKAKAAMEAMAVGAAVILCDFSGVGPMVTSGNFQELRPLNFGFQALRARLQPENLLGPIARYDPQDATRVRDLLRASAGLEQAVKSLVDIYQEVIEEQKSLPPTWYKKRSGWSLKRESFFVELLRIWVSLTPSQRVFLKKLPGIASLNARTKQFLVGTKP